MIQPFNNSDIIHRCEKPTSHGGQRADEIVILRYRKDTDPIRIYVRQGDQWLQDDKYFPLIIFYLLEKIGGLTTARLD